MDHPYSRTGLVSFAQAPAPAPAPVRVRVWARVLAQTLALVALPIGASHAADSIVIGRSLPLSGPLKGYGEAKRDGADAYIAQVNNAGGVKGKTITLITLDDEYQAPKLVANLRQMAKENSPTAFLGLFGVPTVAAALPVIAELKIPAVGLTSGTAAVRAPFNPYVFPVRASYADEARKLVTHVKTVGAVRISVIFTDNPFGDSVKNTLMEALKKDGLTATEFKLDAAAKTAPEVVQKVLAGSPQTVFMAMLSPAAVPVIREIKKAGPGTLLYTFSPVDTTVVLKELGAGAGGLSISQVVPIPAGSRVPVVLDYVKALQVLGRGTPSFYGLEAFIEAKVLVEGLRRASGTSQSSALITALETMHDWNAGGYFVSYKPKLHQGGNFVEIDVIDSAGILRR